MNRPEREAERELRRVPLDHESVVPVLLGLAEEYSRRYGPIDEMRHTTVSEFEPPAGSFFVIVEDGVTLAGGGFRRLSGQVCEVKRLWTSPEHRRRGLGAAVLDALESAASDAGYGIVRLETGPSQPEAVAFYTTRGYVPIPLYSDRHEHALAFERPLDPTAADG